ncbi:hypothetical protein NH340_JMT00636 [Sarcoptes scabiei]|nr:hypothetical protein NH340_JMT00636 [Sarcoptes scabiei]
MCKCLQCQPEPSYAFSSTRQNTTAKNQSDDRMAPIISGNNPYHHQNHLFRYHHQKYQKITNDPSQSAPSPPTYQTWSRENFFQNLSNMIGNDYLENNSSAWISLISPVLAELQQQFPQDFDLTRKELINYLKKLHRERLSDSDSMTSTKAIAGNVSISIPNLSKVNDPNKKRSFSDSDIIVDYSNATKTPKTTISSINSSNISDPISSSVSASSLTSNDSGQQFFSKKGRLIPKLLPKNSFLVHSEHSTPQDSPLDLSIKSLNSHKLMSESDYFKYSNLLTEKATFISSSSIPSLTSLSSINNLQFRSQNAILKPFESFKVPSTVLGGIEYQKSSSSSTVNANLHPKKSNSSNGSNESLSSLSSSSSSSSSVFSSSTPSIAILSSHDRLEKFNRNLFYRDEEQVSRAPNISIQKSSDPIILSARSVEKNPKINIDDPSSTTATATSAPITTIKSIAAIPSTTVLTDEIKCGGNSFTCEICNQSFSLHDRLAKHIASRHKNRQQSNSIVKNYLCEICQRSFARSDMLTRHMRLHTGIKPYTCKICDQVFSRSDHLSTHQRTHTGEKPYKCPQCPYAACRRDMITRHMRTHSRYETPDSSSNAEDPTSK